MTYDCETGRFDLGTMDSKVLEVKNKRQPFYNPTAKVDDGDKMCNWKYTMSLCGGLLSPVEIIKNKIRKFAFEQGFEVEFYSSGWLIKTVEVFAHGRATVSNAKAIQQAFNDYCNKLNSMFE
jgi:hypothetical protein